MRSIEMHSCPASETHAFTFTENSHPRPQAATSRQKYPTPRRLTAAAVVRFFSCPAKIFLGLAGRFGRACGPKCAG